MQGFSGSQTKSCEFKGLRDQLVPGAYLQVSPQGWPNWHIIKDLDKARPASYPHARMRSMPIYGRSTSGIAIDPSACW
jgi:hypothetical protein